MSIIIKGNQQEVPGIVSVSWLDGNPKVKHITDKDNRTRQIRGIVAHTHEGVRGILLPGNGPNTTLDERLALYQTQTDRYVSWDYTLDLNGDVTWQNDPTKFYSWQATAVNPLTLGFEMIQQLRKDEVGKVVGGDLYEGQISAAVRMVDFLTATLGIQRQIPWDKVKNRPVQVVIPRIASGGENVVGIYGHRNVTTNRGPGDPGDALFYALRDAGYELFDMASGEDITVWKTRQQALGVSDLDGIPLSQTVQKLKESGKKHGLWVSRPIDDEIG